jgi:hypothetical protein
LRPNTEVSTFVDRGWRRTQPFTISVVNFGDKILTHSDLWDIDITPAELLLGGRFVINSEWRIIVVYRRIRLACRATQRCRGEVSLPLLRTIYVREYDFVRRFAPKWIKLNLNEPKG